MRFVGKRFDIWELKLRPQGTSLHYCAFILLQISLFMDSSSSISLLSKRHPCGKVDKVKTVVILIVPIYDRSG